MTTFPSTRFPRPLVLRRATAAELMTRRPLSFMYDTPIQQAAALLRLHDLRAAPVIDAAGRPLGLVTASACQAWEEFSRRSSPKFFATLRSDWTPVSTIANPNIDVVRIDTPSREVIDALSRRRAWRVFVTEDNDELVGVISMADVLRHLGEQRRRVRRSGASSLC
jgi:CBS-domain-containing membrane protein